MPQRKKKGPARRGPGRPKRRVSPAVVKVKGGLACPDCDFVAKHAMGLGRHRSARHGAIPKRASRQTLTIEREGAWLTRQEAATRAGVHYNTIRSWEQQGSLGKTKRGGRRGNLLSVVDLDRMVAERRGLPVGAPSAAAIPTAQLSTVVSRFAEALEALLGELRGTGLSVASAPKRRGRPPGSKNKPKATAVASAPKRRGRPPGSKNKTKATAAASAPKRRGRPPGSKNKPKKR